MKTELFLQHKPLLRWIFISGLFVSILIACFYRIPIAIGVFSGVIFMLLNQYLMLRQIATMDTKDVQQGQKQMMLGAAKRFVSLIVFLIVAHNVGLHLLAVAAGLAVAYFNLYAYSAAASFRNQA